MSHTVSPPSAGRLRAPGASLATVALAALAVLAAPPAGAAQAAPAAPAARPELARPSARGADAVTSQLFHVTLVAASRQNGGSGQGELPRAVAKALDDIKDFLPYQGYRVVDSALVRGSGEARTRLKGPTGAPHEAVIFFRPSEGDGYLVDEFILKKIPRVEDLSRELDRARQGGAAIAPMAPEPDLTASFRIARGETVVVGSSAFDGGEGALIVLLTAVP